MMKHIKKKNARRDGAPADTGTACAGGSGTGLPIRPVTPEEEVPFHCIMCGACCRHVENAVMLESLDVYRLARYLREVRGADIDMAGVLDQYAVGAMLGQNFPIMVLKTVGPDDACVFLKDGRCSVQEAKPRACRLYPFTAGPGDDQKFIYLQCMEKPFHFTGGTVRVGTWMDENFTAEDREFILREYTAVARLGRIMQKLPPSLSEQALYGQVFFRYVAFDLEQPFLPQYRHNMALLEAQMQELAGLSR